VENRIGVAFDDMRRIAGQHDCSLRTAAQVSAAEELVLSLRDRDWI